MPPQKDYYTIGRDEAAELLNVSTRTIDRYLKNGRLKFKTVGRNVLVHAGELADLVAKFTKKKARAAKKAARLSRPQPRYEHIHTSEPTLTMENRAEEKIFRDLYENVSEELKKKQDKLEAAGFRIGQLETQLRSSVPLLEWKQKEEHFSKENNKLKDQFVNTRFKLLISISSTIALAVAAAVLGILLAA